MTISKGKLINKLNFFTPIIPGGSGSDVVKLAEQPTERVCPVSSPGQISSHAPSAPHERDGAGERLFKRNFYVDLADHYIFNTTIPRLFVSIPPPTIHPLIYLIPSVLWLFLVWSASKPIYCVTCF